VRKRFSRPTRAQLLDLLGDARFETAVQFGNLLGALT
jgi:hypothetical protein